MVACGVGYAFEAGFACGPSNDISDSDGAVHLPVDGARGDCAWRGPREGVRRKGGVGRAGALVLVLVVLFAVAFAFETAGVSGILV